VCSVFVYPRCVDLYVDVNLTVVEFWYKGLERAVSWFLCAYCVYVLYRFISCIYFIAVSLLAFQATVLIKLEFEFEFEFDAASTTTRVADTLHWAMPCTAISSFH